MQSSDPPLALPDRPSIAVLPFVATGGYEAQAFADSITDHILYTLARLGDLFVSGRNSSFTFKGRSVAPKTIGQTLGVAHLLAGTVDQQDESVVVDARLVDALDGHTLWSERFEGEADAVFGLEGAIVAKTVASVSPGTRFDPTSMRARVSSDVGIYQKFLDAYSNHSGGSAETIRTMLLALTDISEQIPWHPVPLALISQCHANLVLQGWSCDIAADATAGMRHAEAALERIDDDPTVLMLAAYSLAFLGHEHDRALALLDRSLAVNPNSASAHERIGYVRCYVGDPEQAERHFEIAKRQSPLDTTTFRFDMGLGLALAMQGRHEEAVAWLRRAALDTPTWTGTYRLLAASLAHLGRLPEAEQAGRDLLAREPTYRISTGLRHFRPSQGLDILVSGMRQAGIPE